MTSPAAAEGQPIDVLIVGAGFGGLAAAIRLRDAGFSVQVVEKAASVGGTWRDNTYPGAACDVPSAMYHLSFAPETAWTRQYAGQAEILDYLQRLVDRYDLTPIVECEVEAIGYAFDEATDTWVVDLQGADGFRQCTARHVVLATGPLHVPNLPALPGLEEFEGAAFHSARWQHDVPIDGRHVAVVGTGASAAQFIPELVKRAASVTVHQRTPHWVLPRFDRSISRVERSAYRRVPGLRRLVRAGTYAGHEALIGAFLHPTAMAAPRAVALAHLARQVPDPELRRRLTPDYEIGCKRLIMSNDYLPALGRSHVELVTAGIERITATGVVDSTGQERPADVIVFATGFDVRGAAVPIRGREGRLLEDAWADGPQAYLGTVAHGFPNLYLLGGPNTGIGNQSFVFMLEAQIRYLVGLLSLARDNAATRVEVRSHVQAAFNRAIQRRSAGTVWTAGGCTSWYLDENGVNRALWPGSTLSFWRRTRKPVVNEFEFTRVAEREEDADYRGPLQLHLAEGVAIEVIAHLVARYEPVVNAVVWRGRVEPSESLRAHHVRAHQQVTCQVGDRPAVPGVLVEEDPWGGSTIVGQGEPPFAMEFDAELDEFVAGLGRDGGS